MDELETTEVQLDSGTLWIQVRNLDEHEAVAGSELEPGAEPAVAAAVAGYEEDVAFSIPNLDDVLDTVGAAARRVGKMLEAVAPDEATVEFGIEIGKKAGNLVALLVDAGGKATLKISLTWKKAKPTGTPAEEASGNP